MSQPPAQHQHQHRGHGTTLSYTIGFVLSLLCTAIPYHFVVAKTVTGTSLLVTIVGFAFLQMTIQLFFFLHLGRGPKPFYNAAFLVGTVGIVLVVVLGSILIMHNLQYSMSSVDVTTKLAQDEGIAQVNGLKTGACQEVFANHQVIIEKNTAIPLQTEAHLCDSLVFNNDDATIHTIVFGSDTYPVVYGGQKEIVVRKDFPNTITLNQLGTYQFHDQLNPAINGAFTVTSR